MLQKGLMWGSVVVAAVATLAPDSFGSYALVLVVLGIAMGFINPIEDVATRIAIYVLAVLLPVIADAGGDPGRGTPNDGALMDIPVAGEFLVGFLGNFATVIAGVAIASFLLVLYTGLMASGDDSDDGAAEPEAAEPEAAEPEAPSWGGDDSGGGDSDSGAAEPEAAEPEAPSWGGDDSGGGDSDSGAAEPEAAEPEAPSWGGDDSAGSDSDDGDGEDRGY